MDNYFTSSALILINVFPTSVDPVNVTLRTRLSDMTVSPISDDGPVTKLTTPLGKPAFSHSSINLTAVMGLSLEGFITMVHPAASAGPILRVSIAAGKFHGVMAATTPTGFFQT